MLPLNSTIVEIIIDFSSSVSLCQYGKAVSQIALISTLEDCSTGLVEGLLLALTSSLTGS
jgi:hypothetical protein